jgi:hypothetical protein
MTPNSMIVMTGISGSGISESRERICSLVYFKIYRIKIAAIIIITIIIIYCHTSTKYGDSFFQDSLKDDIIRLLFFLVISKILGVLLLSKTFAFKSMKINRPF